MQMDRTVDDTRSYLVLISVSLRLREKTRWPWEAETLAGAAIPGLVQLNPRVWNGSREAFDPIHFHQAITGRCPLGDRSPPSVMRKWESGIGIVELGTVNRECGNRQCAMRSDAGVASRSPVGSVLRTAHAAIPTD